MVASSLHFSLATRFFLPPNIFEFEAVAHVLRENANKMLSFLLTKCAHLCVILLILIRVSLLCQPMAAAAASTAAAPVIRCC